MKSNILIPEDIYQQIPYSSGQLINGNLVFNVPILLNLVGGKVQNPIDMVVEAYFINDSTPPQTLIQGTNYIAIAVQNGITVILLQQLTNCDYIIFKRYTTANFNTDYQSQNTTIKPSLNNDFNVLYSAVQEGQAFQDVFNNTLNGLASLNYVNDQLALKENIANKGAINGYCPLDSGGFIPLEFIPEGVAGGLDYKGTWDAFLNVPFLTAGNGTNGQFYKTDIPGTQTAPSGVPISYNVGDLLIYNGSLWQRVPNTALVFSVNGKVGNVILETDDIQENIAATNLWFTDARAEAVALPLINAAVSGFQTELDDKVNKDTIITFGAFGQNDSTLTVTTNSEGLTTNIEIQPIQIASSQVLDLSNTIATAIQTKTDKIIPTQNGNFASLRISDGNLIDSFCVSSTDGTFFNNSNFRIPTEQATKTYVDVNCEKLFRKGQPNGYASLDSTGVVPNSQLPSSFSSTLILQGTWDALTNTKSGGGSIVSGVGTNGFAWIVDIAGTTNIDGISVWDVGDTIYFDGTSAVYRKIPGASTIGVVTWNGLSGAVVANTDLVPQGSNPDNFYASPAVLTAFIATQTTTNLAEGTNLYFTDERAVEAINNSTDVLIDCGTF